MARAHGGREWTTTKLRTSICDILKLGSQIESHVALPPTATFCSIGGVASHFLLGGGALSWIL